MEWVHQEWLDVLKLAQKDFPEAIIAGGCLRDHLLHKDVKDVDIFVLDRSQNDLEECLRRNSLLAPKIPNEEDSWLPELSGQGPEYTDFWGENELLGIARSEEDLGGYGYKYELISLKTGVLRSEWGMKALVDRFDFGICMIACDGHDLYISSQFEQDRQNKILTQYNKRPEGIIDKRVERLRDKLGRDWRFVDAS